MLIRSIFVTLLVSKLTGDWGGEGEEQCIQQIVRTVLQHYILQEGPAKRRVRATLQSLVEPECVRSRS